MSLSNLLSSSSFGGNTMFRLVTRKPEGAFILPSLIRHASRTTKYTEKQKRRFAREKVRKDRLNRSALEAFGTIPISDHDIFHTSRALTKLERRESHLRKKELLFEIYQHSTDHLLKDRDLTIISQIPIAKATLILTRSLDQFIEIEGETYDLNNRYTEMNRRVYDYSYLQSYLDDYDNEELDLFMKLLQFKNKTILKRDQLKYTDDISNSQKKLIALDTLVGIDDLVIKAAKKFQLENPDEVTEITQLDKVNEVTTDFTDLQDSKALRRAMKKEPINASGFYRLSLKHALTVLEEEEAMNEVD
ncbi:hypothetical protein BN7_6508 [Wickerhamomyces ciferrii]|uniref:Uncharacterized protein n=1 Tax=Wickerhamomyces ciferrii (strain ATCC 14091 / BCRC 22168 / CBS 111 / JCM 3599 / NBRC 0793 / NRRL Y-1031 F-60-10) TaxID=1206466 RepID=K0L0E7_WICCF|nr:uncharacterized protein BN7_6508 [Wickerhamomyces ciferrii]CCH46903.1 hypothetical protein BN7_6508 [Wickerhamomyces ciferrii]